jgi:hypothetical protein
MFEGPEKNLEVVFRKINDQQIDSSVGELGNGTAGPIHRVGLRRLDRDDLDLICDRARCTILSSISGIFDAYVLFRVVALRLSNACSQDLWNDYSASDALLR